MRQTGIWNAAHGVEAFGLERLSGVSWNFGAPALIERAVRRGEAQLSAAGALVGESVTIPATILRVAEDGLSSDGFDALRADMADHAAGRELFAQDLHAGDRRTPLRVFAEHAWRALFAASSFERSDRAQLEQFIPALTVLDLPSFRPDAASHGVSGPFVAIDAERGIVLSGGGASASALVKAIADAVVGVEAPSGDEIRLNAAVTDGAAVALIVGAEGSGKSSLVGPDGLTEGVVGWSMQGLSGVDKPAAQAGITPQWGFGSVVENASLDPDTREPQSEGTLATPLASGALRPSDLFILARDAFGVLPPIARLDVEGAVRFMLLGYGPEVSSEGPQATFDPGFGAAEDLDAYGETLGRLIAEQDVRCWLVNTGWVGPASDETRVPLEATRALVAAARSGALDGLERRASKMFGFEVPVDVPDVDPLLFQPRKAWGDKRAFLAAARELKAEFETAAERLGLSAQDAAEDDEAPFREAAE
ncbi:phosphoenolpyruvate carboxykinase (ATP) [Hansschlegelia quercus]|uniref:phosphoenolpyruvate carboxykinase (ATP) n=1 Tax=Hansschlegelia quercus TaxID=2528245 RepID=A0A4V6MTL6_9HYPH|nr:phosphoenolpyruvate carboxykinase (ATP) [Hansschlegelia quercus]TBN55126.1 phosphoenolpyruvate carboxykinase (ATP) [Hansschlegelia quercus]